MKPQNLPGSQEFAAALIAAQNAFPRTPSDEALLALWELTKYHLKSNDLKRELIPVGNDARKPVWPETLLKEILQHVQIKANQEGT